MCVCKNIDTHIDICVLHKYKYAHTHIPSHTPEGGRKAYYIYIIIVFVIYKVNNFSFYLLICDFIPFFP